MLINIHEHEIQSEEYVRWEDSPSRSPGQFLSRREDGERNELFIS